MADETNHPHANQAWTSKTKQDIRFLVMQNKRQPAVHKHRQKSGANVTNTCLAWTASTRGWNRMEHDGTEGTDANVG